jgi:hypothetical protein
MEEERKDIFTLNGEELTEDAFYERKKQLEESEDIKVVKLNEKTHRTRILG